MMSQPHKKHVAWRFVETPSTILKLNETSALKMGVLSDRAKNLRVGRWLLLISHNRNMRQIERKYIDQKVAVSQNHIKNLRITVKLGCNCSF